MSGESRAITGGIMLALGIVLLVYGVLGSFSSFFYAAILFVLGLVIIFNKNEDKIEQVKKVKGGKFR